MPTPSPVHTTVHVEPGQAVIQQGSLGEGLFVLMRGRLEVVRDNVRIATISQKGSFVGEISSILGCACTATVVATEPCELLHVGNVTRYFETNPQAAYVLAQTMARRIMDMNSKLVVVEQLVRQIEKEHTLLKEQKERIAKILEEVPGIFWTNSERSEK